MVEIAPYLIFYLCLRTYKRLTLGNAQMNLALLSLIAIFVEIFIPHKP